MKRGVVTKSELGTRLVLERKMLGTLHLLVLDKNSCIGCNICVNVCPKEALRLSQAKIENQKVLKMGVINIDSGKCILCGICAVLCPTNAIKMLRTGKQTIPVIETEVFPSLLKEIIVDVEQCDPSCELVCEKSCPTEAINVTKEKVGSDKIDRILNVNVDRERCIFCGRCQLACPQIAIRVVKPFQGLIRLDTDRCSENCEVCMDVCPSKAISLGEHGKPKIEERFCVYCGACQEACPARALTIERTRILCSPIKSGAWIAASDRLMSRTYVIKNLNAKSVKRLGEIIATIDRF